MTVLTVSIVSSRVPDYRLTGTVEVHPRKIIVSEKLKPFFSNPESRAYQDFKKACRKAVKSDTPQTVNVTRRGASAIIDPM